MLAGESPVMKSGGAARQRSFPRRTRLLAGTVAVAAAGGLLWAARGSVGLPTAHAPIPAEAYVFRNLRNGAGWRPPPMHSVDRTHVFRNLRDGAGWVEIVPRE
jgi:hypothetical protein